MTDDAGQIETEDSSAAFEVLEDRRPRIEEPPAVRIVAIDDCVLWAPAGLERQLDALYAGLLGLEREESPAAQAGNDIVYRADNCRLRIHVLERPMAREDFRPLTLVVESLNDLAFRLSEAKVEFQRQRGLMPGQEEILLRDAAGNPVAIGECRLVG